MLFSQLLLAAQHSNIQATSATATATVAGVYLIIVQPEHPVLWPHCLTRLTNDIYLFQQHVEAEHSQRRGEARLVVGVAKAYCSSCETNLKSMQTNGRTDELNGQESLEQQLKIANSQQPTGIYSMPCCPCCLLPVACCIRMHIYGDLATILCRNNLLMPGFRFAANATDKLYFYFLTFFVVVATKKN